MSPELVRNYPFFNLVRSIDLYKLLAVFEAPAGAIFLAKNTSLEIWEHAMSGYDHIYSVFHRF